ncbi:MAG: protein kinase [Myxococcales bacterium]|nr:protein kinase [Myxococcales bacterium]
MTVTRVEFEGGGSTQSLGPSAAHAAVAAATGRGRAAHAPAHPAPPDEGRHHGAAAPPRGRPPRRVERGQHRSPGALAQSQLPVWSPRQARRPPAAPSGRAAHGAREAGQQERGRVALDDADPATARTQRLPARPHGCAQLADRRPLPDRPAHRARRHGQGLQGQPRAPVPHVRAEDHLEPGRRDRRGARAVLSRGPVRLGHGSSEHHVRRRFRRGREGRDVHGHGVRGWRALNRILFREKRLSVRKACEIILQVADALHYVHSQGIVHCDIKTENILITEEEYEGKRTRMVPKLLDFGLARSLVASRASTSLSGTPHYVAPERIRGEPASPASDVYGVGILLYELICGAVPWDGPVQKILAGHLDEVPKPPSQIVEGLDPALERLILHALEKKPANRHKDMAAFLYEMRTVMDMMGISRRNRGGAAKRVVIEQAPPPPNRRDENARIAFDVCRLPLALLSVQGVIIAANPAFAKFVMGLQVEVEGLPVRSTALANAWNTAESDIQRTIAGNPIRRIIEIDLADGEVRRLLLWLDAVSREQVLLGVQPLDL